MDKNSDLFFFSQGFITLLKTNTTLESLSLETNKITGKHLKLIVQSMEFNDTLKELRIANQVNKFFTFSNAHCDLCKGLPKLKFIT